MKRKLTYSIIIGIVLIVLNCTMFFSSAIENILHLKPDLTSINESAFAVHFIDVGQGDAIAIKFPNNETMLVDSGPASGRDNLQEYLDNVFFADDYDTFDYVFLTHSDIDHSGNMNFILSHYKVDNFYRPKIYSSNLEIYSKGFKENNLVYDEIITTLKSKSITTFFYADGGVINIGDSKVEVFTYSNIDDITETNEFSPVLIISSNGNRVYLGGDSGELVEEDLINRGVLKDVDLYKLSHHGSKYSNTQDLINAISPEYVVCSVGDNSYGHPTSEVLLRLAEYDKANHKQTALTFKSTLQYGNIVYYVNDTDFEVITISSVGDYIYLEWWVVVVVLDTACVVWLMIVIIPKKKLHINRHMKNMKA